MSGTPGAPADPGPDVLPPALDEALRGLVDAAPLVAMDFDGVCAPLVDDPGDSRMTPRTRSALEALAGSGCVVALVSGRALGSLREVARPHPDWLLVGSHGAEVASDGETADPLPEAVAGLLQQVRDEVEELVVAHPGSTAEHKPTAVVLHTRRAEDGAAEAVTQAVLAGPGARDGVHVKRGHDVVELSVVEADKGTALRALRERVDVAGVLYAGDDVTDEDAFAVLRAADVGVKVGDGETAAPYRVASVEQVPVLLERLVQLRAGAPDPA